MKFLAQLFGGRGAGSGRNYLHFGRQGKHWEWHNNFQKSKSKITIDPNKLQDLVNKYGGGKNHGHREFVDFGEIIGQWLNPKDGNYYDTTRGTIHWGEDGGYHVVPAPPSDWKFN